MLAFWPLTLQIGHTVHGRLDVYWKKIEQSDKRWYVLGIMTYYAFYISRRIRGMELTGRMIDWKIRDLSEILRTNFSKFYNPSQNLALDEVIVKFKEDSFQTVHPERKKTQTFRHQNVQTMDCSGYTHNMNVYLGKERQRAAQHLTATYATVTNLTRGVEGFGYKLHVDNFVSSPDFCDDLAQQKNFLFWDSEAT